MKNLSVLGLTENSDSSPTAHKARDEKPHIIYIFPEKPVSNNKEKYEFHYIDFNKFAAAVEDEGEIVEFFADHLRKWACVDAGARIPRPRAVCKVLAKPRRG